MILAIDVGNTNIVVGCIDDLKTYFIERLSTNRTKTELEYAVDLKNVLDIYHIKKTEIEGCIISSVVPQITNIVKLAAEKILSFHTINSHRINIFRKLGVNNVHEATKYAMRAGIVDLAEYYI